MTFDFIKNIHRIRKLRKEKHLTKLGDMHLIEDKKILFEVENYQKDMMYIQKVLEDIEKLETFEKKSKKFKELLNRIGIE